MSLSSGDFCGSAEGGPYLSVLKVFLKCRLLFRVLLYARSHLCVHLILTDVGRGVLW